MRKVLSCNIKMHCSFIHLDKIFNFVASLSDSNLDIIYAVPYPYLQKASDMMKDHRNVSIFAQDISQYATGAHTGEVSAEMLEDLNISGTIIGHSERRISQKETNESLRMKVESAIKARLRIIFCVGESLNERERGETLGVIEHQLKAILPYLEKADILIAYEPVWAIGTGKVPTNKEVDEVSLFIKNSVFNFYPQKNIHILYGGSVNEENCEELTEVKTITGFLVGGCSTTQGIVHVGKTLEKS